ncbi:MAG: hypothetical protein EP298_03890 [Gammaproteobacteria bacterium]|nr:MAG: hypothetical protein EP298_03890 [Gammaproteobacteria bacterium]UTW43771.1 hypothetical protein KFE69_06695 [bacterium SCSIO 12844]
MVVIKIICLIFALCAIYSFYKIIKSAFQAKTISTIKHLTSTLIFSILSSTLFLLSIATNQWQSASENTLIASLYITQKTEHDYCINLNFKSNKITNKPNRCYHISGDQWMFSAQVIQLKPWLRFLNLKPLYRLGTLSGIYDNIEMEQTQHKTIYPIEQRSSIDLWQLLTNYPTITSWFVEAKYGNAVFMPLINHAQYNIYLTNTGLMSKLHIISDINSDIIG